MERKVFQSKRNRKEFLSLFPVPVESNVPPWPGYKGKFNGHNIVVAGKEMFTLYFQGYFGKGNLSRSEPVSGVSHAFGEQFVRPDENVDSTDCQSQKNSETLHLSLEEAFFLSYALGCLQVENNGRFMNIDEMWDLYARTNTNFPVRYAAYHHYRSRGWVVRSGIKFACDFLLYKNGPDFYHSSYSVKLIPVPADSIDGNQLDCTTLSGLSRITEGACKELLICYVHHPGNDFHPISPTCLQQFEISEVICKRWVASQERDGEARPASLK